MINKILLAVAALLIVLLITVRYLFKEKFEIFKTEIANYESSQLENFRKEKQNRIAKLTNGDEKLLQLFTEQFDESKAISEQDTTFSFLYLSETIKYKAAPLQYIDCLNSKCVIDQQNESVQKLIEGKEEELEKKYGETYSLWFPQLKNEKLLKATNKSGTCSIFFPDMNEISYDENIWNDFEKFMIVYNSETREANIQNKQTEYEYFSNVSSTKNQLRSNVIKYFDEKLADRKRQIISTQSENITYNSPTLGLITYTVNRTSFDKQAFQSVADDAFEEQWKYNSLNTGAMPYAYCFGSSNYCDYYGCSRITVTTGGSDVLVTIKDESGDVVRHGYIKSGHTFSFNLPDGTYQTFFYSGTGWNPNMFMKTTSCGTLRGVFVSFGNVTKDNYISLYKQQMTYELISQLNGNFSTKQSSTSEAL